MSGYGFKDQKGVLYLGVRMWLDQGNYVKQYIYDKNYPIMMQLNNIVQEFDFEYKNKL